MVSARSKIKPDKITVYTDGQQDSCWWRRILPYIDHQYIHSLPGKTTLNGHPIELWAHISDFLRLSILYHVGGMYIDSDIFSLNSFDPLFQHQMVVGQQCGGRENVALMMAQRHSCVICKFAHLSCRKFTGEWISHSVNALASFMSSLDKKKEGILSLPFKKGFHPFCWDTGGINQLFYRDFSEKTDYNISEVYSVHLYHRKIKDLLQKTIHNYEWIQTSKSLVALSIRRSLPSSFTPQHLDETAPCSDIPL